MQFSKNLYFCRQNGGNVTTKFGGKCKSLY
jgi:hypothetical protein